MALFHSTSKGGSLERRDFIRPRDQNRFSLEPAGTLGHQNCMQFKHLGVSRDPETTERLLCILLLTKLVAGSCYIFFLLFDHRGVKTEMLPQECNV